MKKCTLSDIYVPIFQSEENERLLQHYFSRVGDHRLEYAERIELRSNMMSRDPDNRLTVNSTTLPTCSI